MLVTLRGERLMFLVIDYKSNFQFCCVFHLKGYYTCLRSKTCAAESVETKNTKMDALLNNAPASFGGIMLKFSNKGCFYYMCSRNNNFSNRSQKGVLCISWMNSESEFCIENCFSIVQPKIDDNYYVIIMFNQLMW